MKFRFIWVGKTRNKHLLSLQEDYFGRLNHFAKCSIVELRDSASANAVAIESKRILENLNQNNFAVLLDVNGRTLTSQELAGEVEKWQDRSLKEACFIIGGAGGVSSEVAERADFSLSLSFLTFTHEMARVVLLEQLYRAFTIIKGFPYQR